MANLNKVFLIGRLTRDPELRYTPSGTAVAEFGLATNRTYNDQTGQKKEVTCFVELVIFGRRAEVVNEYLSKGQQVFVEGRLDFESWEGKNGEKRSRHRVHIENFEFLGAPGGAGGGGGGRSQGGEFRGDQRSGEPQEPAVREPSGGAAGDRGPGQGQQGQGPKDDFDFGELPF